MASRPKLLAPSKNTWPGTIRLWFSLTSEDFRERFSAQIAAGMLTVSAVRPEQQNTLIPTEWFAIIAVGKKKLEPTAQSAEKKN